MSDNMSDKSGSGKHLRRDILRPSNLSMAASGTTQKALGNIAQGFAAQRLPWARQDILFSTLKGLRSKREHSTLSGLKPWSDHGPGVPSQSWAALRNAFGVI
jgi:hypothetical protein